MEQCRLDCATVKQGDRLRNFQSVLRMQHKLLYTLYWESCEWASMTNSESSVFTLVQLKIDVLLVTTLQWELLINIWNFYTKSWFDPFPVPIKFRKWNKNPTIWMTSHWFSLLKTTINSSKRKHYWIFWPCTIFSLLFHCRSHEVTQSQKHIK